MQVVFDNIITFQLCWQCLESIELPSFHCQLRRLPCLPGKWFDPTGRNESGVLGKVEILREFVAFLALRFRLS